MTLEQLQSMTDTRHRWIRMMPNTPLEVAEGVISFSLGEKHLYKIKKSLFHYCNQLEQ